MGWLLSLAIATAMAHAGDWNRGFKDINGQRIYLEHKPAKNGKATLVLANGLTYSTRQWALFIDFLEKQDPDLGILAYDMRGQGNTLLRDGPQLAKIDYRSQVADLRQILDQLKIENVHLMGLSYGAAIGFAFMLENSDRVRSFISIAPFLAADPDQDAWVLANVRAVRSQPFNALNLLSNDDLYDYFLRILIYQSYPTAEPIILENAYKLEAVFRMVQGVRKFSVLKNIDKLPKGKIHFIWSSLDEYLNPNLVDEFIKLLPAGLPLTQTLVAKGHHKIPEHTPQFLATWVHAILRQDPIVAAGAKYVAEPFLGRVKSKYGSLYFPKERHYAEWGINKNTLGTNTEYLPWSIENASCAVIF